MTKQELISYMNELAQLRPVFHSEADFQHELASVIKSKNRMVRLERPFKIASEKSVKFELDLEIDNSVAIELKYKKASFKWVLGSEEFDLHADLAITNSRYDVVYDAKRVRDLVKQKTHTLGFTIFLTNTKEYWELDAMGTKASQFDLTDKRKFRMGETVSLIESKTIKRSKPFKIEFNETLEWIQYSEVKNKTDHVLENGTFKFLIIDVNNPSI
jgi:hypothetical protein